MSSMARSLTTLVNVRALALLAGALAAAAVVVWVLNLGRLPAVVVGFVAAALANAASVWWDERVLAQRRRGRPEGLLKMIGSAGYVIERCGPDGTVRVGLEVWRARAFRGDHIAAGTRVLIRDVERDAIVVDLAPRVDWP